MIKLELQPVERVSWDSTLFLWQRGQGVAGVELVGLIGHPQVGNILHCLSVEGGGRKKEGREGGKKEGGREGGREGGGVQERGKQRRKEERHKE